MPTFEKRAHDIEVRLRSLVLLDGFAMTKESRRAAVTFSDVSSIPEVAPTNGRVSTAVKTSPQNVSASLEAATRP
jgi:hypothetical protein